MELKRITAAQLYEMPGGTECFVKTTNGSYALATRLNSGLDDRGSSQLRVEGSTPVYTYYSDKRFASPHNTVSRRDLYFNYAFIQEEPMPRQTKSLAAQIAEAEATLAALREQMAVENAEPLKLVPVTTLLGLEADRLEHQSRTLTAGRYFVEFEVDEGDELPLETDGDGELQWESLCDTSYFSVEQMYKAV